MASSDSGTWGRFDDDDEARRQGQIVTAISRTAANLASRASLETLLAAIAEELAHVDGIAAAQLVLVEGQTGALRMMGAAGFTRDPAFLELLEECHRRGAPLATYAALETHGQIIYRDRRVAMLADDVWRPLHGYIQQLEWNDFVATPFSPQGVDRGVVHCYLEPGFDPGGTQLSGFLLSMADQAALAVDYHDLIEGARSRARDLERQRLARDLHDSVIQSVFSIGMHARALESVGTAMGETGAPIASTARDLQELSHQVQVDLRGIVRALQPSPAAEHGIEPALRRLAGAVGKRAGIPVEVSIDGDPDALPGDLIDDLYYIASEATHNAVKHARATGVAISVAVTETGDAVTVRVADDGTGLSADAAPTGYGLSSMRYRASRWHGGFAISPGRDGTGTVITADLAVGDDHPMSGGAAHDER